jgi:signal transduction histidine kinase
VFQDEGLLHDARNLIGTIGLYCDLLSLPGVLKPEHRQYSAELRHLGERSGTLIDQLMHSLLTGGSGDGMGRAESSGGMVGKVRKGAGRSGVGSAGESRAPVGPVNLRALVERRSGLLQRVANGSAIEFSFGPAAASPVRIEEEAVERILVNLVRNAAAAQGSSEEAAKRPVGREGMCDGQSSSGRQSDRLADKQSDMQLDTGLTRRSTARRPGLIRITLGMLTNRLGEPKPWPFQQVRLSVEDCGCGMADEQVQRLLLGRLEPRVSRHGIGFSVVRELVAATQGELQVVSAPGVGTRVQIEWPVAATRVTGDKMTEHKMVERKDWSRRSGPPFAIESGASSERGRGVNLASGTEGPC